MAAAVKLALPWFFHVFPGKNWLSFADKKYCVVGAISTPHPFFLEFFLLLGWFWRFRLVCWRGNVLQGVVRLVCRVVQRTTGSSVKKSGAQPHETRRAPPAQQASPSRLFFGIWISPRWPGAGAPSVVSSTFSRNLRLVSVALRQRQNCCTYTSLFCRCLV